MERKQLTSIVIGVLALGLVIFLVPSAKRLPGTREESLLQGGGTQAEPGTRALVPIDAQVPGPNSLTPSNVAKPTTVVPASPGGSESLRRFSLEIQGDKFSPDTVIINKGDVVELSITALDKNYDFTQPDFGFKKSISRGQTQEIGFQASAVGKFTFFCSACGGPDKGPVGYVIIVEK